MSGTNIKIAKLDSMPVDQLLIAALESGTAISSLQSWDRVVML